MQPKPTPDQVKCRTVCPPGQGAVGPDAHAYYPGFDWLRATLAIVVMLGHDGLMPWKKSGSFAVDVFFALSGWLVGSLLLRKRAMDLPRFYFDRAVRIWIPYYLALVLLLTASLLHDAVTPKWVEFVLYKCLMVWNQFGTAQLADHRAAMPLQGTGNHFWSVNAEEQFYLLAPILLVLSPKWGRHPVTWALLAGLAISADSLYASILVGVLAAVSVHRWGRFHQTAWFRMAATSGGIAGVALLASGAEYHLVVPVCAVAIVLLLAREGQGTALGKLVGGMSYPLYLNHWIGVFAANALLKPSGMRESWTRHALAVVINVLVAVALYWTIDRRVLARRAQWFTPQRGALIASAAFMMVFTGICFGLAMRP